MRRSPVRIRTFILGTVLVLLVVPALAGGAAWLIERDHQQSEIRQREGTAIAYLTSHGGEVREPAVVRGFARLLDRLGLLAAVGLVTSSPPGKVQVYASPALGPELSKAQRPQAKIRQAKARQLGAAAAAPPAGGSWVDDGAQRIPLAGSGPRATLGVDLYHRRASATTRALVALVSGVVVLLAGLAVAVWLTGRWMVLPLARLSAQVDGIAGGALAVDVPRSRIGEVANIAGAVEGMATALDEASQRRAEADEARRFLVTSVAHDLRTPLFALRGHLQAIGSRLGDPGVHLARAEARADALERLIGNLFAYTRDDYAQPATRLEATAISGLLLEVAAGLEHATRLRGITLDLEGDGSLDVIADRDRLKRALTNILDNALRYSPPGAAIHLSWAAVTSTAVEVTVRDRGPGIDPDLLPHVFEPGVRGTPAGGGSDDGAGLGLTIARRLLEHQQATVTARNDPGGGTVIAVSLRRAPA